MSEVVVGLDISMTATGVAFVHGRVSPISPGVVTVTSAGRRADSLNQRSQRLTSLAREIHVAVGRADLVVIEGPSVMSKGGSNWDRAGLWWLVVAPILDAGMPVAVAAPSVVKKFAAGKGNADKAAVAVGIARLWPEVNPANDNEFDALTLATMGAQWLGLGVPSRAHHADVLTKVAWPEEKK